MAAVQDVPCDSKRTAGNMNNQRPGILRRSYRGLLTAFSESLYWFTKPTRDTDPQGSFLLPKALEPFFYPAICISIVITAAIALSLPPLPEPGTHAATMQGDLTLKQLIYKTATLKPSPLGSATAGALFIAPILYFASGGASMLANYLKRKEEEARNPETVVQLKEARKTIEEKDEAIARLEQENKDLRDRHGLNDTDC